MFNVLDHFNYPQLDVECTCNLCATWRSARDEFDEYKRLTFDHNRSCMCWRCKKRRRLQQFFLAAAAKRELYCEFSWHASRHPSYGPKLMSWVADEIAANKETNGWWATLAQAYSLSYWFARFQSAYLPQQEKQPSEPVVVPRERLVVEWWCSWCGEDLPIGGVGFCSDDCRADHAAHLAANQKPRPRIKLPDWALSAEVSGSVVWAASGIAA